MRRNQSGSVLILSFWALIILSLMAFGITKRVLAQVSLARHQVAKVQAKYAAYAGLFFALDEIRKDKSDSETGSYDTRYRCGVSGEADPLVIWDLQQTGAGSFQVAKNHDPDQPGLSDETGKINISVLNNYEILKELLQIVGVVPDQAEEIAVNVIKWKDEDGIALKNRINDSYNQQKPEAFKNRPFESLSELLMVKGVTPEIYEKIKPYLTVYPAHSLTINFNTASEEVLRALASSMTAKTNTNLMTADGVVEKIVDARAGMDGQWGTGDDPPITVRDLSFSGSEIAVQSFLTSLESTRAVVIRAEVIGTDQFGRGNSLLTALIRADGMEILSLRVD